ncbi:hypothetical protein AVEN_139677-1 [Araneus ventricosus]|uniref:Uncharacterized protein n=1 Tax=Araneus ventricosus TaxID=182803 RepID=A0A4Y2BUM6_ARAVE|nr:hypothetical protein AVEN_139677-1 [Araneus ventricosus]
MQVGGTRIIPPQTSHHHYPSNGVVQWCSLGGNGCLALSATEEVRRESGCKTKPGLVGSITQNAAVCLACSTQANRRRQWCGSGTHR